MRRPAIHSLLASAVLLSPGVAAAAPPAALATAAAVAPAGGDPLVRRIAAGLRAAGAPVDVPKSRGSVGTEVFKKAAPSTVLIVTNTGSGSGSLLDGGGTVLTNNHVIAGAHQIVVVFRPKDGRAPTREDGKPARVLHADPTRDLALIRVEQPPADATPLGLADMGTVEIGQDVHAIGHPEGEAWTYTTGIVSQIRRDYEWSDGRTKHRDTVIQTQTPINPGNSGGPLLNDAAQLVGVNTFTRRGSEGINYAVAVETVKEFLANPPGPPPAPEAEKAAPRRPEPAGGGIPPGARTERYGDHIVGVYARTTKPPPDVWLVYRDGSEAPAYAVRGQRPLRLDVVIQPAPEGRGVLLLFDSDCNGAVDVVGYSSRGDGQLDEYGPPSDPVRLDQIAPEMAEALARHTVPYRGLALCR